MNEELAVIKKMGFCDYLLIVYDFINMARKEDIYAGPGRGCFLPRTLVKSQGKRTEIQNIVVGESVIDAYGNNQLVIDKLEYVIDEEIIDLEFADFTISCTKDHLFLTNNRGWVKAEDLDLLDDIVEV
jgi:intein/homing endonuclease